MKQFKWLSLALVLGALVLASSALANPVVIDNSTFPGDTCEEGNGWSKINGPEGEFSNAFGSIEWPGTTAAKVEYSINQGYTVEVCIKDGTGFITYEIKGELAGEVESQGGNSISHVSYRVTEEPVVIDETLVVTKDARASYDRTVTWELDKSVDPASHSGQAGDSFESTWTVDATKSEELDNFQVKGSIWITNPAPATVTFTVSDELNDGTGASVSCPKLTIGENETVECTYSASPPDDSATLNIVDVVVTDVVWDPGFTGTVVGDTASATVSFEENLIGDDEVTLDDDQRPIGFPVVINDDFNVDYEEPFECPADGSFYTDGRYSFAVPNTATLKGAETNLSASAEVTVECRLPALTVVKTADGAFDLPVEWDLEKEVEPDFFSGGPGDEWFPVWTVTVTRSLGDAENFRVTGDIIITNPAEVPQDFTVDSDVLNDAAGTEAVVTCPDGGNTGTVPAGGSVTCTYVAEPDDDSADLNTVTVSALGNDPVVATDGIDWVGSETGQLVADFWDPYAGIEFEDRITLEDSETIIVNDVPVECTEVLSEYTDGFLTFDVENVAFLNNDLDLSASAEVTVECRRPLEFKGETAWASNELDTPLVIRYTARGNWATYVVYNGVEKTTTLYAGQTIDVGEVVFSAANGTVTITIHLDGDWIFDPNPTHNLMVQGYTRAPSGNPAPGRFADKASCEGFTCDITVDRNNFYGVHVNVGYWH